MKPSSDQEYKAKQKKKKSFQARHEMKSSKKKSHFKPGMKRSPHNSLIFSKKNCITKHSSSLHASHKFLNLILNSLYAFIRGKKPLLPGHMHCWHQNNPKRQVNLQSLTSDMGLLDPGTVTLIFLASS